ncbi:MAG: hypothetical protein ACLRFJ_03390 [Alphaproteobacteria bacterium]
MNMGNAKKETVVDANGNKRTSRIPQKPLNQFVKAALLTLLKRDDISIKNDISAGSNTITVLDSNGKYLFSYDNAWDYGYYCIFVANPKEGAKPLLVAEMDWYESDSYTNPQQQDIFDVFKALNKKRDELQSIEKARQDLTPEEVQALQALGMSR